MDKKAADARVYQCNPTHKPSGPGHSTGYQGPREKPVMDNKGNQKNPDHQGTKPNK